MKIVKRRTFTVLNGAENSIYLMPSAEKLSDGSIIVCAMQATYMRDAQARIRTLRTFDGGQTFVEAVAPTIWDEEAYPDKGYCNCHIAEIAPGELTAVYMLSHAIPGEPFYHPTADGIVNCTIRTVKSLDNGATWSRPRDLDVPFPDVLAPGKPLALQDGNIGFPVESQKIWDSPFVRHPIAGFIKSYDRGESYTELNLMVEMAGAVHGDGRVAIDASGRLTAYLWKYDLIREQDMLVHESRSSDHGVTWTHPTPLSLKGQITSPLFFADGTLLCMTQDRFSEAPGIKAFLSHDNGLSWDTDNFVTVYGNEARVDTHNPFQGYSQYKFGYSSLLKTSETQALAFYFFENGQGHMSIGMTELERVSGPEGV